MSYDGWMEYNGVELVNLSRTAQLADALGIDSVRLRPADLAWIQAERAGVNYGDVSAAPWYDAQYPASSEFAGIVPLGVVGLDDSTLASTPVEYITDGGHSGKPRNATLPIVFNVAVVARTERGAEFGKRWMDRVLRDSPSGVFCSGADLRYFRHGSAGTPTAHRRDVRTTRGSSVTRKRTSACSATWISTFTMTAADPYEYGQPVPRVAGLGGVVTGSGIIASGSLPLVQAACPAYDYSPIYDPLYPTLVAPPATPDPTPEGWDIDPGMGFTRYWARINPEEPSDLLVVPTFTLRGTVAARKVRVSLWPNDSLTADQCDPLFSTVVSYLPPDVDFYVDGEQKASYVWDGISPTVRRADSLVYGPDASPVQWAGINDRTSLLFTLDIFDDASLGEGDGTVRAALALTPKSD